MAYKNNIELAKPEKENPQTAKVNYEIAIDRYKLGELSGLELREAQNGTGQMANDFIYRLPCTVSRLPFNPASYSYKHPE